MGYEYWLRLGRAGTRFAYLAEKLAGSKLCADDKTLRSRVKVRREINDMFKKLFGKVPGLLCARSGAGFIQAWQCKLVCYSGRSPSIVCVEAEPACNRDTT